MYKIVVKKWTFWYIWIVVSTSLKHMINNFYKKESQNCEYVVKTLLTSFVRVIKQGWKHTKGHKNIIIYLNNINSKIVKRAINYMRLFIKQENINI